MAEENGRGGPRKQPWYADGLRFECQPDCGACCTNHDEFAYVYLEGDDVDRLVAWLEMDEDEFLARFTDLDDCFLVLRMDSPDCPFLDGTRCSVYPARPIQCRTFPFWHETLQNPRSWKRLRNFCPGIDQGPRHELLAIRDHLSRRKVND